MSVQIKESVDGECNFYCTTTEWAFGPIMPDVETAEAFLKWLPEDPRTYKDNELESKWYDFRAAQEAKKLEEKTDAPTGQ